MKGQLTPEIRELTEHLKKSWADLSPIALCNNMAEFQKTSRLSERKLAFCFDLSKSEIHRILSVARLSVQMKNTCAEFGTDYHTLCIFAQAPSSERKEELREKIVNGSIRRHKAAKEFLGEAQRVARKKAEVVLDGKVNKIICKVCQKSESLDKFKGMEVLAFTKAITDWSKPHKRCKRI